jgi:phosphoribosyl 1,2-cyclic phosphodiesterase
VKVTYWGTRGSIASPGPETVRYGGNTSCVEVRGDDGTLLVLDAGTGIRRLNTAVDPDIRRVDILLTHLHMDHIQGLGFFGPLRRPGLDVHIWGPASTTQGLAGRLTRYLSPPLFPVRLRDLPCNLTLHEVPTDPVEVNELRIESSFVCHPGPTVGYRITGPTGVVTYIPDHEPALGVQSFPGDARWTSGFALAEGADLLIHDTQYTGHEYASRVGWGHSSIRDSIAFARLADVGRLAPFHHEPSRDDDALERTIEEAVDALEPPFPVTPAAEGDTIEV